MKIRKTSVTVGAKTGAVILGVFSLVWGVLHLIWGQAFLNWWLSMHFITGITATPVTLPQLLLSVFYHALLGGAIGAAIAAGWQWAKQ